MLIVLVYSVRFITIRILLTNALRSILTLFCCICPVFIGMPGAYSVSAPTKRSQKQEEMKSSDDMYYHRTVGTGGGPGGSSKNNRNAGTRFLSSMRYCCFGVATL